MNTNTTQQPVINKDNFVSPIRFAEIIGKNPQQVYSWMKQNKIPESCIYEDMFTGRKMLVLDKVTEWYNNKPSRSTTTNTATRLVGNPSDVLEMMVGWFKEAGQEQLANDLGAVLAKMQSPEQD